MFSKNRKMLTGLLTGTATGLLMVSQVMAASIPDVDREDTLVVAHQAEAPVYRNVGMANPYSINNEDIRGSILNMFEPLFYYNSFEDKIIPWLAKSYEYNDDFTKVTVTLRDNAKWSDGEAFSADDVVFTFNMLAENGRTKKDLIQSTTVADAVKSVSAPDATTVVFDLNKADPRFAFKFLLNHYDIGLQILPKHVWQGIEDKAGFDNFDVDKGWPVTTGPWNLVRFTDTQIFMDRRDDWWAAQSGFASLPEIKRVVTVPGGSRDRMAQLITAGQVDITGDIQVTGIIQQVLAKNPTVRTFTGTEKPYGSRDWWPTSLYFNHLNPKWSDVRVRKAVNYYINRDQIIDVVYDGASERKYTPFPGFGSLKPYIDDAKVYADQYGIGHFDLAKGDALMKEAGYVKNSDGFWEKDGVVLSAKIETISILNAIGPVVAQQLRNAGLDVEFRSSPESRSIMRDGKFDLTLFGHRGSISDPYATLDMYTCKNALPEGQPTLFLDRWCNEEFDKLVAQVGKMQPGEPELRETVKKAMAIWMENAVEVPIAEWYHRIPVSTRYWKNWPSTENPYLQPTFWYTSGQFGYVMQQLKSAK